jgi:hypothetical protein
MKKTLIIAAIAAVVSAGVFAQDDDGIGLSAGLEFGVEDVGREEGRTPYLMPHLIFENAFFDGALDVFAELDYTFRLGDKAADERQLLSAEEEIGYNLKLGEVSTLSFILNNVNEWRTVPALEDGETIKGVLDPGIKYTHTFGFGDLYIRAGFPLDYLTGVKDAEFINSVYGLLGASIPAGIGVFGAELTPFSYTISPEEARGLVGYELLLNYETDKWYAEVELIADGDFAAFIITPRFEYYLNALTFYAGVELADLDGETAVSPFIGIRYSW